jgi:hypothetical protein
MSPKIFRYTANGFEQIKTSLDDLQGWWQTVTVADVNGDGRQDLLLGNLGENFYLHPSTKEPVKLFLNDFDNNGQADKVITRTIDGKDKPIFMKAELESQMPFLKKQNLRNNDYAKRSVQELFSEEKINTAVVKQINYASSCIALNNGSGNFILQPLPFVIQLSSVKAILPADINEDGKIDLVVGGNEFGFQPQLGRLDASTGDVLINNGAGNFNVVNQSKTGVAVQGQVRDIITLKTKEKKRFLFLLNNEYPVLYELKNAPPVTAKQR